MDKTSSLFQHQIQKAAPPTLVAFLAHACAHYARTLHYNPMFFAFTAFTTHRKTPHNDLIRLYDFCFSPLPLTLPLHLCLHPYSPDFQPLSPIGEGVKAIYTHYNVYARARERKEREGNGRNEPPHPREGGTEESEKGGRSTKMGTLRLTTEHSLTELIKDEKTISS